MKNNYSLVTEKMKTVPNFVSAIVELGGMVIGSNITREGIKKLLRTYCKEDYDRVDEKVIIEDFYQKGKQIVPHKKTSKKDSGQVRDFKKPQKSLLEM